MLFHEQLNEYMSLLDIKATTLCELTGISNPTMSRYRSGKHVPENDSEALEAIVNVLAWKAQTSHHPELDAETIKRTLLSTSNMNTIDKELVRNNFNTLITQLNLNLTDLCKFTNYNMSSIFRYRTGERFPSDATRFISDIASYIASEMITRDQQRLLAQIIECTEEDMVDYNSRYEKLTKWITQSNSLPSRTDSIAQFLNKLDSFDLNDYIKAIHFDEMNIPSSPFSLPTSKVYYGLKEMMQCELDFLKATVLSKSSEPVIMYSNVPLTEMSKDPEFPKKWMFGMALMLKKGLQLHFIHDLDRSLDDMMLGLESWIPMYMTGQISPYYFKQHQTSSFHRFLRVSGAAIVTGETVVGYHTEGRYYLSKSKKEIEYYKTQAEYLLKHTRPLMEIYRENHGHMLNTFIHSNAKHPGLRRSLVSSPPLYVLNPEQLTALLERKKIPEETRTKILNYAAMQLDYVEKVLSHSLIEVQLSYVKQEDFEAHPLTLSLSGLFLDYDVPYTYEEYQSHLEACDSFAQNHENYIFSQSHIQAFSNLHITMHEKEWAMISKDNSPAIHFVIRHPKLLDALWNFNPPVTD